jgi:hypothetical protein
MVYYWYDILFEFKDRGKITMITIEDYKSLCKKINLHRIIYYCLDYNIINDFEYDKLEKELKDISEYLDLLHDLNNPLNKLGSSNIDDYDKDLVDLALILVDEDNKNRQN